MAWPQFSELVGSITFLHFQLCRVSFLILIKKIQAEYASRSHRKHAFVLVYLYIFQSC